ncbi:hypothetical protein EDD17DRAFT_1721668 [Pisolithus thermaeus]|nr:hypothetical protein EDD17DRAFT_1721668 [Pisolithus thermaeus]
MYYGSGARNARLVLPPITLWTRIHPHLRVHIWMRLYSVFHLAYALTPHFSFARSRNR